MCKENLITGVKVSQQMSKAMNILNTQVIPREELFQIRKKEGKLSQELRNSLMEGENSQMIEDFDAKKHFNGLHCKYL